MIDILTVSLLGALLSLDRTAVLQSMIARPIVTAPLIGLLLGDVYTGIVIGAALELLWISLLPLGAYIPPDENLAAVLTTSCTIIGMRSINVELHNAFIVLNILFFIPFAYFGRTVDKYVRIINNRLSNIAERECDNFNFTKVEAMNIAGMLVFYALNFITIFILLSMTVNITPAIYNVLPVFFTDGLEIAYPVFLIVGAAAALWGNKTKNSFITFTVSFLLFSIILELL